MPVVKNARLRHRIIDDCLRNSFRRFPTIEDLRLACEEKLYGSADGNHVSKSTIEKDLREMKEEYDAPIAFHRSERGYLYTDESYSLEKIPLSAADAEALRFAVLTLDQFKNLSIFKQFHSAINKIFDRVYISENMEDEAISQYVQFETVPVVQGSEWLNPLLSAIKNKISISFLYESYSSQQVKKYFAHPYLLKEYRHRWYLICFNPDKGGIFTFELGRIKEIVSSGEAFVRSDKFDVEDFFRHAFGITVVEGVPENIVLEFTNSEMKYITSQPLHTSQEIVEEKEHSTIIKLRVFVTQELIMTILSYGDRVRVLEPQRILKQLIQIHQSAIDGTQVVNSREKS